MVDQGPVHCVEEDTPELSQDVDGHELFRDLVKETSRDLSR